MADEILAMSATALAQAIRDREVKPSEAVGAYIERLAAVNPSINAVVTPLTEEAVASAESADDAVVNAPEQLGVMHGVPITIKDCFAIAGTRATVGTLGRADATFDADDVQVARLRAAGAIPIATTSCPEMLMSWETDNLVSGRTNNPYDLERTCGGSSGGEAAVQGAGGSALGLGSDSAGSIRVPAHYCGVAGLKPTSGRVPQTSAAFPSFGALRMLRAVGPIARSVDDLWLALQVLAGPDGADWMASPVPLGPPGDVAIDRLRLGWFTDNGIAPATPETVASVRRAAGALEPDVATTEQVRPAGIEQTFDQFALLSADRGAGLRRTLGMMGTTQNSPMLEGMLGVVGAMPELSGADVAAKLVQLDIWRGSMMSYWADHDVLVCPTVAAPAPQHGTTASQLAGFMYSVAFNFTGWPAATVRCGAAADGLPIGVQIVAPPWREDIVLAVAARLERALGGWRPSPIL